MTPITIIVSPEPRNPAHPPQRARFVTAVECPERALGAFSNPLCSAARVLLSEGVQPETVLRMRHAGSDTIALTATVGTAAGLDVREETGDGKPRFVEWKPFKRSKLGWPAAADLAATSELALGSLPVDGVP
jgi:hypothetical protein